VPPAQLQEIRRDIAEYHLAGSADRFECCEGDQSVATTDVEDTVAARHVRVRDHSVTNRSQVFESSAESVGVTPVSTLG
jgi:hypothetical protein